MKTSSLLLLLGIFLTGVAMEHSLEKDQEQQDKDFYLLLCTEGRWPEAVSYLLNIGANIEARTEKRSNTPLHRAAFNANGAMMKLLLKAGARVNARNGDGATPLHLLIASGNVKKGLVQLLLDHGAQIDARDLNGETPFHYAARINSPLAALNLCEEYLYHSINCEGDLEAFLAKKQLPIKGDKVHSTAYTMVSLVEDRITDLAYQESWDNVKPYELFEPELHDFFKAEKLITLIIKVVKRRLNKRHPYGCLIFPQNSFITEREYLEGLNLKKEFEECMIAIEDEPDDTTTRKAPSYSI